MLFSELPHWFIFVFVALSFFIKRNLIESLERVIELVHRDLLSDERYIWSLLLLPFVSGALSFFILGIFIDKALATNLVILEMIFCWLFFTHRFTLGTTDVYAKMKHAIMLMHVVFAIIVYLNLS